MSAAVAEPTTQPTDATSQPTPVDATGSNGGQQGSDAKTFSQAELDAIVKDRLERERKKREADEAKAKADAEEKALQAQAEFKALADKRGDRIVELEAKVATIETLQQERDRFAAVVDDLVKQQRDGLPEWVIELLDGKDAVEQLAWITKNRDAVAGSSGGPTVPIPGVPRPAGNLSREQLIEQEKQRLRGSGRYG